MNTKWISYVGDVFCLEHELAQISQPRDLLNLLVRVTNETNKAFESIPGVSRSSIKLINDPNDVTPHNVDGILFFPKLVMIFEPDKIG